jgi:predicted Rossmann fold flavoprotein
MVYISKNQKERNKNHFDVIVVGGGASGMMAAGRVAELGKSVLLLEKNPRMGEKLKITGGGRCNVTNAEYDIHALLAKYGKAKDFLFSPFSQFGVQDTFNFFEVRGLPLIVEAQKRAFPKTQKAMDVFKVMDRYARNGKVTVRTNSPVTDIKFSNGIVTSVKCQAETYTAEQFIFATGGLGAPQTGSTGDGFNWLKKMGHGVQKSNPNIVPIKVKEAWVKVLSGVSLISMKVTFYVGGKKAFSKIGRILFTHFGFSGPLILNSANEISSLLHEGEVTGTIDIYPNSDFAKVEKEVLKVFETYGNKLLKNTIEYMVPAGIYPGIEKLLGKELCDKKAHSISRDERKKLVHLIKSLPFTVEGLMGYERSVVSDGGVPLTEIDMKTMRSKLYQNLYITGDLLHINRPSGGYSLQLCWTTGYVAGSSASGV